MTKNRNAYTVNASTGMKAPLVCSFRLSLACLAFFGFFICYAQRNGLSVAIVCMADPDADNATVIHGKNHTSIPGTSVVVCRQDSKEKSRSKNGVLWWPKKTRGFILGSFYWGYALTQIASSVAVNRLGPKRFLALIIFISSLATALLPLVTGLHSSIFISLRVLAGAAQGGLWPTIFRFWSTWAPVTERTTLISFQSSGPAMGTVMSLIIGGFFCTLKLDKALPFLFRYGWSFFFYLLGGFGMIWSIVWVIVSSDIPLSNRFMSTNEKEYICACKTAEQIQNTSTKTPWGSILRSRGFWCVLVSMFFSDFGLYAIWTVIPEYMNEVLFFNIEQIGRFSAFPHVANFIMVMLTGGLADFIIRKEYLTRVNTRKLFHGIGALSPAICLLIISFLTCQRRYLAVSLLIIGVALNGFLISGGTMVSISDFSGIHSGVILGICNTISSIGGFCVPYLTSIITRHKTTAQWQITFMLYAGSFLISAIVFSLMASGETEKWARNEKMNEKIDANAQLLEKNGTVLKGKHKMNNPIL